MAKTKEQGKIDVAFATVVTADGRFGIGAAERDQPGYWPMPGYGTFGTWEQASARCQELNARAGIEPETAVLIVASSMRGGK